MAHRLATAGGASLVVATLLTFTVPASRAAAADTERTRIRELSHEVVRSHTFPLPLRASHVAVHWPGQPDAGVVVAFSRDGTRFGEGILVQRDEQDEHNDHGPPRTGRHDQPTETYGGVMFADGARAVRVTIDRPLGKVSVVAIDSRDRGTRAGDPGPAASPPSAAHPPVISRAGWGADESLRFDGFGDEIKPVAFYPVQKLVVHHTATANDDPDPPATIRAIYYYHTLIRGWGDIGYNFLIDAAGNVYEGRYSREYAEGEIPTGEDLQGNSVQGAHAGEHNAGSIGIAMLGTLTAQDATPAARASLEQLLAAKADRHGVDPNGAEPYVNPVTGADAAFPNIAGHRDINSTACPGDYFYGTLPALRDRVASLVGSTFWQSASPRQVVLPPAGGTATFSLTLTRRGGFVEPVDLEVAGLPGDWTRALTQDPATGTSATLTIDVPGSAADGAYPFGVTGTTPSVVRTSRLVLVKGSQPDTVAPMAEAPRASVLGGSQLGTDDVPALVQWSASDDQGPILRYTLQQSRDDGPWKSRKLQSPVSRSTVRSLLPGHSYRFQVRATDASGNTSTWAVGHSFAVRILQETDPAISYAGTWVSRARSSASGGSVRKTTSAGATATLAFTGRGVAWVSHKSATRGQAEILIDGASVATADLASGPSGPRRIALSRAWTSSATHTITIRVLGTPGRPKIDVDALVVLE